MSVRAPPPINTIAQQIFETSTCNTKRKHANLARPSKCAPATQKQKSQERFLLHQQTSTTEELDNYKKNFRTPDALPPSPPFARSPQPPLLRRGAISNIIVSRPAGEKNAYIR